MFDAVLIVLGDQPLIQTEYLNNLISKYKANPKKIIATQYSDSYGVPIVVSQSRFSDLLKLKGDKGAKEFLNSQQHNIIALKTDALFDVDTEEDYKELINRIEKT